MCTHGPDPAVSPTPSAGESAPAPEAGGSIQCFGDGTSGKRVQVLYAYSTTSRLAAFRPRIAQRAAEIDAIYDASARQTGGRRHVRWLTDANCDLSITAVQVSSTDLLPGGFGNLMSRLRDLGFGNNDRKYLIWVDTGTSPTIRNGICSGAGVIYADDDRLPTENDNDRYVGYTRVDDTCLFALFDRVGGKVEAHELMHTFGAVQDSAPNRTGNGHCRDDYDIMCYVDGPGVTMIQPYRCPPSDELRLDCQDNDYFSTNAPPGSYLATHWNAANSSWLECAPAVPQPPDPPPTVTARPALSAVNLTWSPPPLACGQPLLGYRVFRDGVAITPAAAPSRSAAAGVTTTATSFTDTGRVDGTTYSYQVAAVSDVGEGARTAAVSVTAGSPRPDALIAAVRNGPFAGDNVYASTTNGNPQTQTQSVARGGSVTAYLRVQNDSGGNDTLKVKGVASGSSGYTVRYFRGTTDITTAVAAGSYTIANLGPGAFVDLSVKITATASAAAGSSRTVAITVKSKTVKTIKDVVQTSAARR